MKIKPEHYNALKKAITPNRDKIKSHREFIIKEGKAKDVDKRLRWDFMWAIPRQVRTPIIDEVYKYANDDHLDTVLKRIIQELS